MSESPDDEDASNGVDAPPQGKGAGSWPPSIVDTVAKAWGEGVARRTRRLRADGEKRSICVRRAAPGASVAQVARRHAVNAGLIFKRLRGPRNAPAPAVMPPTAAKALLAGGDCRGDAVARDSALCREPHRDRPCRRAPDADRRTGPLRAAPGRLAHVRCKVADIRRSQGSPVADGVIGRIARPHAIENEGQCFATRCPGRTSTAPRGPVFDGPGAWLDMQRARISGKSPPAGAIRCALTRLGRLRPHLGHGLIAGDTGAAERGLRPSTAGRDCRAYSFSISSGTAVKRSATRP